MAEMASLPDRVREGEAALARGAWEEVVALHPGHPYLRLPLQFATALEERLLSLVSADELQQLRQEGEAELQEPGRWGTTFTLLQGWGRVGWPTGSMSVRWCRRQP